MLPWIKIQVWPGWFLFCLWQRFQGWHHDYILIKVAVSVQCHGVHVPYADSPAVLNRGLPIISTFIFNCYSQRDEIIAWNVDKFLTQGKCRGNLIRFRPYVWRYWGHYKKILPQWFPHGRICLCNARNERTSFKFCLIIWSDMGNHMILILVSRIIRDWSKYKTQ